MACIDDETKPGPIARPSLLRYQRSLCWRHHDRLSSISIHTLGKRFWEVYRLERGAVIAELQTRYELETGRLAA